MTERCEIAFFLVSPIQIQVAVRAEMHSLLTFCSLSSLSSCLWALNYGAG
jgi:hypothetical protein